MLTNKSSLNLEEALESYEVSALFGKIHAVKGSIQFEPLSAVVRSLGKPVQVLV